MRIRKSIFVFLKGIDTVQGCGSSVLASGCPASLCVGLQYLRRQSLVCPCELTSIRRAAALCGRLSIPTTPEQAWHRRLRAKRQHALQLLLVARGADLLLSHHGNDMAPRRDASKADWHCRTCAGHGANGKRRNKGTDTICIGCRLPKGKCFGEKVKDGGSPTISVKQPRKTEQRF